MLGNLQFNDNPYINRNTSININICIMMSNELSLYNKAILEIRDFMLYAGYQDHGNLFKGVLSLVSMISDYKEEGVSMYPDVLIVRNEDYFKSIRCFKIKIDNCRLIAEDFSKIIKMCAPLANNGWIVYIQTSPDGQVEYGLVNSDISEMGISMKNWVTTLSEDGSEAIFISNIGDKLVLLSNGSKALIISLSLNKENVVLEDYVSLIAEKIIPQVGDICPIEQKNYLIKVIIAALKDGHGNLIAVLEDNEEVITNALKKLHGGKYVYGQIDFVELMVLAGDKKDTMAASKLHAYACIIKSMLNFDGITLFTNTGRIIGYHYIVENNDVKSEESGGGSRTRAFNALCKLEGVIACFMKSQDGKVLYYDR